MSLLESQIDERAKLDAELTERAYAELAASVSAAQAAPRLTLDDIEQIDGAARACLKYCGIRPGDVPEDVRDFEERLEWLCRPTGTMRRTVRLDDGWHNKAFGAMLGKLDNGEAIALLPRGVRGYCYLEPGTGRKVHVTNEVAKHIDEEAVLFYKPLPAKPLTTGDLVSFVAGVFNRQDYLLVLMAAIAVTLIGLLPAWANKIAFGIVAPSGQARLILPIGAMLLGVAVSTALITACRNLVMDRVSMKLDVVTESAVFSRILTLPTSFFKQYSSGNLANRVANVTLLTQLASTTVLGSGLTALLSILYVVQIAAFAPALAGPALAITLAQAAVMVAATLMTRRFELATAEANAKLSGTVTALLNGVQKIKLAGAEDRAFARWARDYSAYAKPAYNRPVLVRAMPAVVALIGIIGVIVIYYLAGTTQVAIDDYMAFNAAYGQVTVAITAFATVAGQIARIRPMLETISPILEAVPETAEDRPCVQSLSGSIEMSNVTFRYNDDSPYIIKDLSLKIRPGEYVAIVGKSGCGKSTIMRLLLGFEEPERGTIFFGQYDIQKVDTRSLRRHIGSVTQDGRLFMGDIASNILISTPNGTVDDAWEAAEIAGIADDIRKMPMGMQTFVTEGSGGISGGQRQRLMIARAVCGNRSILLFDEATSALDNKTQKHVSDSLETLNCTRLVIAHRLSTVRHCDRILVVNDGRIAEEGTYEELVAKGGLFAELVERQRLEGES